MSDTELGHVTVISTEHDDATRETWMVLDCDAINEAVQRKHVPCSVVGNLDTEHRAKRNASHRSPLRVITSVSEKMVPREHEGKGQHTQCHEGNWQEETKGDPKSEFVR